MEAKSTPPTCTHWSQATGWVNVCTLHTVETLLDGGPPSLLSMLCPVAVAVCRELAVCWLYSVAIRVACKCLTHCATCFPFVLFCDGVDSGHKQRDHISHLIVQHAAEAKQQVDLTAHVKNCCQLVQLVVATSFISGMCFAFMCAFHLCHNAGITHSAGDAWLEKSSAGMIDTAMLRGCCCSTHTTTAEVNINEAQ